jgi:hypothetical protein
VSKQLSAELGSGGSHQRQIPKAAALRLTAANSTQPALSLGGCCWHEHVDGEPARKMVTALVSCESICAARCARAVIDGELDALHLVCSFAVNSFRAAF